MTTVTVHHAKTHLSALIAAAERGEEVVIARGVDSCGPAGNDRSAFVIFGS